MSNSIERRKYIPVNSRTVTKKLFLEDIVCIEKEYHHIIIKTVDGNISLKSGKLDIRPYIADSADFFECHSYLLINLRNVESMQDGVIIFSTGEKKKIGRRNFSKAKAAFAKYIAN